MHLPTQPLQTEGVWSLNRPVFPSVKLQLGCSDENQSVSPETSTDEASSLLLDSVFIEQKNVIILCVKVTVSAAYLVIMID